MYTNFVFSHRSFLLKLVIVLLVSHVSSKIYFPLHLDPSYSDSEGDIQPIIVIDSVPQPFDAQNTRQPSSSLVGKSQNCLVSNVMSLVYVVVMPCMSFIVWRTIPLAFMGLLFHISVLSFTTHGSISSLQTL